MEVGGYTLGLDIGSNSVGWGLVDERNNRVINAGVRVFPEGVDRDKQGGEQAKNATRREARSARRRCERRARRLRNIRNVLRGAGLWPETPAQLDASDPYRLRAEALDRPLEPWELGRAIFRLGRLRGFKSNRRTDGSEKAAKEKKEQEQSAFYQQMTDLGRAIIDSGARTLGDYLWRRRLSGQANGAYTEKVRGIRPLRSMVEAEFDAILDAQARHHPGVITAAFRERLRHAIFYQRPLKPVDRFIGNCELEPDQRRCPWAHRAAQRFRMLQEVNNLRIIDPNMDERPLTREERAAVLEAMGKKKEVAFTELRTLLGLSESHRFNLERGEREKLAGHRTDVQMGKKTLFGERWFTMDDRERDRIVDRVLYEEDEEALRRVATERWGLDEARFRTLMKVDLPRGYCHLSLVAIRKLLPHMEAGLPMRAQPGEESAYALAGYEERLRRRVDETDLLPPPPEDIRNPLVKSALHQVRRVVNAIIKEYGKPAAIHIELAREIRGGAAQRERYTKQIRAREKERTAAWEAIKRPPFGVRFPGRDDIDRYLLWEDQRHECPYCGQCIAQHQLFTMDVEVDHILPYSRSLDDSYANKVTCHTRCNAEKLQRTPYEWLSGDEERYGRLLQFARRYWAIGQGGKARKFSRKTCEIDDFLSRQLSDTAYITTLVHGELKRLGCDVVAVKGQTTADLRERWGLNTVLRDDGLDLKSREDHRHHALDAIVVALTTRPRLQALASGGLPRWERRRRLARGETRVKVDQETGELIEAAQPWPGFRSQVEAVVNAINVSHKPRRRVSGALHEETVYARTNEAAVFTSRKPLESLTLSMVPQIVDDAVRATVERRLEAFGLKPVKARRGKAANGEVEEGDDEASGGAGGIPKQVWKEPLRLLRPRRGAGGWEETEFVVRSVTVRKRDETIMPIRAARAAAYVKPGANHHVAIFELPPDHRGRVRREAVWVSRIEAARRVRAGEPVIVRTHPSVPDAAFLFSLSPGDLVLAEIKGEKRLLKYKTGASTQGQMYFVDSNDARPDKRAKKFATKANTLKARKVTVDILGRIRWAND